jgi:nucleotide-binding universal stress UspA family protein
MAPRTRGIPLLSINVIVVPTDFSRHSLAALDLAVGLADSYGANLKVIFVNEPGLKISDMAWVGVDERTMSEQHVTEARRSVERVVLDRIPVDIPADAEILHGEAVAKIIEYAADVNADLIVMSTHGRTGMSHAFLGSVAQQIVRRAPCPVMTLKRPSKK